MQQFTRSNVASWIAGDYAINPSSFVLIISTNLPAMGAIPAVMSYAYRLSLRIFCSLGYKEYSPANKYQQM